MFTTFHFRWRFLLLFPGSIGLLGPLGKDHSAGWAGRSVALFFEGEYFKVRSQRRRRMYGVVGEGSLVCSCLHRSTLPSTWCPTARTRFVKPNLQPCPHQIPAGPSWMPSEPPWEPLWDLLGTTFYSICYTFHKSSRLVLIPVLDIYWGSWTHMTICQKFPP